MSLKPSLFFLVLANLIPLAGAMFYDWEVFPILVLFWFENVIVGVFFILRILFASGSEYKGSSIPLVGRLFLAAFFTFHYGMFSYGHGLFVFGMFGGSYGERSFELSEAMQVVASYHLELAIMALAISHAVSFVTNYLLGGEGKDIDIKRLMTRPYQRVVVLHVTILIGGFVVMWLGQPVWALVILIGVKIFVYVQAHIKEHTQAAHEDEGILPQVPADESGKRKRRRSHRGTGR